MLDADVKAQLKGYLERLVQPIELVANVDDSEGSRDMMDLLRDVAEQSSMIVLAATLLITVIVLVMDSGIGNGFKFIYKQLF